MSAGSGWFSSSSNAANMDEVELENRGESINEGHVGLNEQEQQLLPDMTDEEIDRMKLEKAKLIKRQQLDIILNSETSIASTLAALKKSLRHYEKEKMDLYAKRQKYRIVVANYKGPVDDKKLEAIKTILHKDLPNLIDEMDDRLINGHAQLASLEKQLENLRVHRLKAEKAYKLMFEPMEDGDLEAAVDDGTIDPEDVGKNVSIEYILSKYDPENYPMALPAQPPKSEYDTSSDEELDSEQVVKAPADLSLHPEPHAALLPDQASSDLMESSSITDSDAQLIQEPVD